MWHWFSFYTPNHCDSEFQQHPLDLLEFLSINDAKTHCKSFCGLLCYAEMVLIFDLSRTGEALQEYLFKHKTTSSRSEQNGHTEGGISFQDYYLQVMVLSNHHSFCAEGLIIIIVMKTWLTFLWVVVKEKLRGAQRLLTIKSWMPST